VIEEYLKYKHAIVTGGGRGIGAAIADELARRGAGLTVMGRDVHALEEQAARLGAITAAPIEHVACDVTDEASVTSAFAIAREKLGVAYVLVNNAGQAEGAAFLQTTTELWARILDVNLTGTFLCTRQVLPSMIEAKSGRVINIASIAGLKGFSHVSAYCASKHGVIGLTRALAAETAKSGITVNAVCPSYTEGEMTERAIETLSKNMNKSREEAKQMLIRRIPRGALIRPQEVAAAVAWLCAPAASAITGQAIAVSGGEVG
jgi:3-hydroxybutyrate dehydrogenase